MPSPINSRRFGVYPLLGGRGRFPLDPPKMGKSGIKFLGNVVLSNVNSNTRTVYVGPPATNKILVIIPSTFYNGTISLSSSPLEVDDVTIPFFDATDVRSSQSLGMGIGYVPYPVKSFAKIRLTWGVSASAGNGLSLFSVISPNPNPIVLRKSALLNEVISVPVSKGSVGVYCIGSGQPVAMDNLVNGIVDRDSTADTGRMSFAGRIKNPARPVTADASDSDGYTIAVASWN